MAEFRDGDWRGDATLWIEEAEVPAESELNERPDGEIEFQVCDVTKPSVAVRRLEEMGSKVHSGADSGGQLHREVDGRVDTHEEEEGLLCD